MRRYLYLAVALAAFALAAVFMRRGERVDVFPDANKPSFPSRASKADRDRAKARRTVSRPPPVDAPAPEAGEPPAVVLADPVDLALSALQTEDPTLVVLEANAIRHSPLGELLLDCLGAEMDRDLAELREETGFDPIEQLDRVSMVGDNVVISGQLEGLRQKIETSTKAQRYGESGFISGGTNRRMVVWGDELMAAVRDEEAARQLIDVLEGRAEPARSAQLESIAYGEAYGRLPPDKLARFIPEEQAALREEFLRVIEQVELHADTMNDPALSFKVGGEDAQGVDELGRALGGAVSLARASAKLSGDEELARLLEFARIGDRHDGGFTMEMVLPLEVIRDELLKCDERKAKTLDAGVAP